MSIQYICELCSKEFKQKIDYTRHKDKKNACVTADKLKQVITQKIEKELERKNEQKINHDSTVKTMSTLFSSCMNILRDNESLTGDKALRNLSYLLVLKLIEPMIGSEIDLESFDYSLPEQYKLNRHKFLQYSKFSEIAASKQDDIPKLLKNIWDYILSKHPKTKDIFLTGKGFDMKKQATFRKLIDKLSEFDFTSVDYDIQGHAYEDLLKDIMTGKVLGQFFTQPLVKDMMVDLINPQLLNGGKCETIFDPAMGTGGFLMTSLRHLQKQAEDRKINIDWGFISSEGVGGRETEPDTFQLCKTNMLVSCGHMIDNLQQGDSIRDPIRGKYDIVLANPPFGIKGLDYKEIKKECKVSDEYLPIESKSAVPLFLQVIISILKVGGRCAMVMPDGQELFGKGKALVALREYLMKSCDLREVIYLPSGVFSNTSIKTCVLYFHKKLEVSEVINKPEDKKVKTYKFKTPLQTEKVQFYDYNPYEKVKNLLIEVDACKIAENNYSLNYAEYLQSEEQGDQDEKENNSEVEWKTLGEVCEFKKGKQLSTSKMVEGAYPVIGGGQKPAGYHNEYNIDENSILCSSSGAYAGFISMYKTKVWASDCFSIIPKPELIQNKYLYYYLKSQQDDIYKIQTGVAQPHIYSKDISKLKIPIPSLQAQQRIVERLDYLYETCTETSRSLIEQFKTKKAMVVEMGTEGVETTPLGEVCEINQGNSLTKEQMNEDIGENPVLGGGKIIGYYNKTNREGNSITLTRVGDINVTYMKIPHFLTDNGFSLICNNLTTTKYVYYYLSSNKQILQNSYKGTAQKVISKTNLKLIQIPIPSLQTQKRIVEQCERIDKLMADLETDREASKDLAASYLKSCIEPPAEPEQEYTDIIISDEEYSETETKPVEQEYTDIIISDEYYDEQ
jgi:restriction endonuclease S subunit/type I restriction-modification system DNA methylase subunit